MPGRFPHVLRFLYNVAFKRRPTRDQLIAAGAIDETAYPGFMPLTRTQLETIARMGGVDARLVVDQA